MIPSDGVLLSATPGADSVSRYTTTRHSEKRLAGCAVPPGAPTAGYTAAHRPGGRLAAPRGRAAALLTRGSLVRAGNVGGLRTRVA